MGRIHKADGAGVTVDQDFWRLVALRLASPEEQEIARPDHQTALPPVAGVQGLGRRRRLGQ